MTDKFDDQVKKLLNMRKKVDDAKAKVSRLEGQVDSARTRMKKEHGVDTVEAAQVKLAEMDKELTGMEQKFSDGMAKLEGAYDWWGNA